MSQNCGLLVWQVKLVHGVANFISSLNSRDEKKRSAVALRQNRLSNMARGGFVQRSFTRPKVTVAQYRSNSIDTTSTPINIGSSSSSSDHHFASLSEPAFDKHNDSSLATPLPLYETSFVESAEPIPMDVCQDDGDMEVSLEDRKSQEGEVPDTSSNSCPSRAHRQLVSPDQAASLRCRLVDLIESWQEGGSVRCASHVYTPVL